MAKLREPGGLGDEFPPEPWRLGGVDKGLAQAIRKNCAIEVLAPGQAGLEERLREYVRFRYAARPESAREDFQRTMSKVLFDKMISGPMTFTLLRYLGEDATLRDRGEFTLKTGAVVGVNSAKQTFIYPDGWFRGLLEAEGKHSMDELTAAVTSEKSPYPFRPFGAIEELDEGPERRGEGAGFLLMALVDERLRGLELSQDLVRGVLRHYLDGVGLSYALAYGRAPQIGDDPAISAEQDAVSAKALNRYIADVLGGRRRDWGVHLHQGAGARILCGLPDSVIDEESMNCGFLGIYDLKKLRSSGSI
jgi:hypothetical protein